MDATTIATVITCLFIFVGLPVMSFIIKKGDTIAKAKKELGEGYIAPTVYRK